MQATPSEPSPRYLAVIGDLVASRELRDDVRSRVQELFLATVKSLAPSLGLEEGGALAAAPAVTAGDEFQVLLHDPWRGLAGIEEEDTSRATTRAWALMDIVRHLTDELHPARIVFGAGHGPLSTAIDSNPSRVNVAHLDGPCFHAARAGIDAASDRWLVFGGSVNDSRSAWVINGVFELMHALRSGWTEKQRAYVKASRGERTGFEPMRRVLKEVADEFSVSPSVVTESLQAAHFEALQRGELAVTFALLEATRPKVGGAP